MTYLCQLFYTLMASKISEKFFHKMMSKTDFLKNYKPVVHTRPIFQKFQPVFYASFLQQTLRL